MIDNTDKLISKLIEKTKNHELLWKKYDAAIYSLKTEKDNQFSSTSNSNFDENQYDSSYVAYSFGTIFFLITYYNLLGAPNIKLCVQTDTSSYSKTYAHTGDSNKNIISELKRLYNIVESYDDPIDESIRAFIEQ